MIKKCENEKKILLGLLIVYFIAIMYCMFFAFNRVEAIDTYRFQLIPNKWPLMLPGIISIWIFDLGNIVAFIPFGILIPKLLNIDFKRFIILFSSSISALEILQSLTGLGAFDIDDIISNTLGAIIGYIVYKKALSDKVSIKNLINSTIIIIISITSIMFISETGSKIFKKTPGTIHSIAEFEEINKKIPQVKEFDKLLVLEEEIIPTLNLYSGEDIIKEYNYKIKGMEDVIFYAKFCVENDANLNGRAEIYINGEIIYSIDASGYGMESIEIPFDRINEVKIKVSGDAKLWDVGISKLNYWWSDN